MFDLKSRRHVERISIVVRLTGGICPTDCDAWGHFYFLAEPVFRFFLSRAGCLIFRPRAKVNADADKNRDASKPRAVFHDQNPVINFAYDNSSCRHLKLDGSIWLKPP